MGTNRRTCKTEIDWWWDSLPVSKKAMISGLPLSLSLNEFWRKSEEFWADKSVEQMSSVWRSHVYVNQETWEKITSFLMEHVKNEDRDSREH